MYDVLSDTRFLVPVAAALGAVVGSFLNVVIWRLPRGESVVRPGSHCTACGAPVRWYDNVPVLSYLVLRGRCRACGVGFSAEYPIV
jgi:leader peptidase (prepilin peptidase)/N-methyltransferase